HGLPVCIEQLPATQKSAPLHLRPSSHCPVRGTCVHVPAPSQTSFVQLLPSPVHPIPAGLNLQRAPQHVEPLAAPSSHSSNAWTPPSPHDVSVQSCSQPSPSIRLPSSHSSSGPTTPLPQRPHLLLHPSEGSLLPSSHSSPTSSVALPQSVYVRNEPSHPSFRP